MNKYLKCFLHRGLIFGGFGPIVAGIIYLILSFSIDDFSVGGTEMFTAIFSTYILAFVHAGASIFNQIESWPIAKSLLFHFGSLYLAYTLCYLINSWIPFKIAALLIYTLVFIAVYFAVWLTVVASIKVTSQRINKKLSKAGLINSAFVRVIGVKCFQI